MRGHDDQAIDPPAHVAQRFDSVADIQMHVGQEQMALVQGGFPLHAAQHFGEIFTVQVGQDDADRAGARHAEIAGTGMGDIVELARGLLHPLLEFGTHVGQPVEHARHGCDRHVGFARDVANGRLPYVLSRHPQSVR